MYKAIRKIFFASIFVLSIRNNSNAQTYVLIPDANFATYLQGLIPSAMSGNSLNITSTLVTSATQAINVYSLNISSIAGIQYFTSLTVLDCSYNSLTSLPALPNSLTWLNCNYNSLTSLPAIGLSLTYLSCNSNSINTLPPLPSSLTFLSCGNNPLNTLPALPSSITSLECSYNSLGGLPTLPSSLINLTCSFNSLTSLPALPSSLVYLDCRNNSLTSLPTLPSSFNYLRCSFNSLTSLPVLNSSLTDLYCNTNSLTTLPALPNSLVNLFCHNNYIKCFPAFPPNIQGISLGNNPFTCIPNYVLPAMNSYTTAPLCVAGNTNGCAVIGIKELNLGNILISVYPNPSAGSFNINIDNEINNGELILINSIGQVVYTHEVTRGENKITSGITSSGLYQLVILQNKQPFSRGKLVID